MIATNVCITSVSSFYKNKESKKYSALKLKFLISLVFVMVSEYAYTMKVTMAGNVYSFGVVLLELLTGEPPVNNGFELARWALNFSTKSAERELMLDSRISKTSLAVRSQMLSVLRVALACVSVSPKGRPKMRQVLRMIFNAK